MTESGHTWEVLRNLRYPGYDVPYLEWYRGYYDCVFVCLHPFVHLPDDVAAGIERWPDPEQIRAHGRKLSWAEAGRAAGIEAPGRLNQALLTTIGALRTEFQDVETAKRLEAWLEASPVWPPAEGCFEELLEPDILAAFRRAGDREVHWVAEFGDRTKRCALEDLERDGSVHALMGPLDRGGLFPPSRRYLFVVDWDSFFTLFCGPQPFVRSIVTERSLDGFFAGPATRHGWWRDAPA